MTKRSLQGKIVWITGASRGIGAALAEEYASHGARLILSAPDSESAGLEQTRQRCKHAGQHHIIPVDLTQPDEIDTAFIAAIAAAGRIDILINNAGITHRSQILETSMSVYRRVMEVNFFGPVTLTKRVLPEMIRQGGGQIVVISSVNGLVPTPHRAAYCAAKHAITGWSESLRAETAEQDISVSVVFPGFVKTDIALHALTGDGGKFGKQGAQANAMSAEELARRVVAGVVDHQQRLLVGGKELALVYLGRFSPSLVSQIVRRVAVT